MRGRDLRAGATWSGGRGPLCEAPLWPQAPSTTAGVSSAPGQGPGSPRTERNGNEAGSAPTAVTCRLEGALPPSRCGLPPLLLSCSWWAETLCLTPDLCSLTTGKDDRGKGGGGAHLEETGPAGLSARSRGNGRRTTLSTRPGGHSGRPPAPRGQRGGEEARQGEAPGMWGRSRTSRELCRLPAWPWWWGLTCELCGVWGAPAWRGPARAPPTAPHWGLHGDVLRACVPKVHAPARQRVFRPTCPRPLLCGTGSVVCSDPERLLHTQTRGRRPAWSHHLRLQAPGDCVSLCPEDSRSPWRPTVRAVPAV